MGVRIIIGTSERNLSDIEQNWVNEQITRRRQQGVPACVKVIMDLDGIDISLATADCQGLGGLSRQLTAAEIEVVDLWNRLHLGDENFSSGNLVAFLKQIHP